MMDDRPGLAPRRLVRLMRAAIERCSLDLTGAVVLTEAASGAYVVTPVVAAMSGASKVFAIARSTPYGSVEQVSEETQRLAYMAEVSGRIEIVTSKSRHIVEQADIVTNSGHVRPIDAQVIDWMKPGAVIPLMYEAWELRPEDLDLVACRRRGIAVAGTNERHPAVNVFSYLGIMAVKLLLDAGVSVYGCSILLLCDNPFLPFVESGLAAAGAKVETQKDLSFASNGYEAILVVLQPRGRNLLSKPEAAWIQRRWPGAVVAQFWGDIDRTAFTEMDIPVYPSDAPPFGHMGILPSAVGPEPIVRLQAGGLKVGEVLRWNRSGSDREYMNFTEMILDPAGA